MLALQQDNLIYLKQIKENTLLYQNAIVNAIIETFAENYQILPEIVKQTPPNPKETLKKFIKLNPESLTIMNHVKTQQQYPKSWLINCLIVYTKKHGEFYKQMLNKAYKHHQLMVKQRKPKTKPKQANIKRAYIPSSYRQGSHYAICPYCRLENTVWGQKPVTICPHFSQILYKDDGISKAKHFEFTIKV